MLTLMTCTLTATEIGACSQLFPFALMMTEALSQT